MSLQDIQFGDLRRTAPIADDYGFSRGLPIDRYYIERFLRQHAAAIHGTVAEFHDDGYTRAYGGARVTRAEVIDIVRDNPRATICADLQDAPQIGSETFDCIICTQTLQYMYEVPRAIQTLHRILKPGGVVLVTLPGITQIGAGEAIPYWQFTERSARRLFADVFGDECLEVQPHGNVLSAIAFLHGLAVHELHEAELDSFDRGYQLLITVKATRAATATSARPTFWSRWREKCGGMARGTRRLRSQTKRQLV